MAERLAVVPITFAEASAFVVLHHRHHSPSQGHKFSLAVADDTGTVRGVANVGRPVSKQVDDGWTLEVTRVATDGVKNGCSMLYGACWRAARALGYRKLVTYTLASEPGTSLRAAGWRLIGTAELPNWKRRGRPRVERGDQLGLKMRWEAT